jgi:protein-S-isoprenylcysteine O-methyltransferase Ste14
MLSQKKKSEGYVIPKGFLFEYIDCPNYLGEIIEWIGYAFVVHNLSGVVFAFATFSNLFPRALEYHRWYKRKFNDAYPKDRKAIIPFTL